MQVHALFFASYRDLVGAGELSLEVPDGCTVSELVRDLRGRGRPFDRLPEDPAVAVNQCYSAAATRLSPDDEVAFIPPVAGG